MVTIDRVTTALNKDAASGSEQERSSPEAEQDESEFTGLAQQQPQPEAPGPATAECAVEKRDQQRFGGDHACSEREHEQRTSGDKLEVEQHANRQEEQSKEDRAKRLDVAF